MFMEFSGYFFSTDFINKTFLFDEIFQFHCYFELPDIDLVFEFFISAQLADLKKSASSTVRPKL